MFRVPCQLRMTAHGETSDPVLLSNSLSSPRPSLKKRRHWAGLLHLVGGVGGGEARRDCHPGSGYPPCLHVGGHGDLRNWAGDHVKPSAPYKMMRYPPSALCDSVPLFLVTLYLHLALAQDCVATQRSLYPSHQIHQPSNLTTLHLKYPTTLLAPSRKHVFRRRAQDQVLLP